MCQPHKKQSCGALFTCSNITVKTNKRIMSTSARNSRRPREVTEGPNPKKIKVFNDNVHSLIKLPLICHKVINTPEFQRLRNLKQLGLTNYVFPAANHNRFEHCIGTSHLAGTYAKILQENQPDLHITDVDVTCLYLAGLCHDLGHGPFSHLWEEFVNSRIPQGCRKFEHEEMSVKLFRDIWTRLEGDFRVAGLAQEGERKDKTFIEELIYGKQLTFEGKTELEGRPREKQFLYLIVSNDDTKIDVDKFDYLMRDCRLLNIPITFQHQRIMENSKIIETESGQKIAYRHKVADCLDDLFNSRFSLHKKAYKHRTTLLIGQMVIDSLLAVEPSFRITGRDEQTGLPKSYSLATAHNNTSAYIQLTDSIAEKILWADEDIVGKRAKQLFENVINRKLYTYLGSLPCTEGITLESIKGQLGIQQNSLKHVIVLPRAINYGGRGENPLNKVQFYDKKGNMWTPDFRPEPEEKTLLLVYPDEISSENGDIQVVDAEHLKEVERELNNWCRPRVLHFD